MEENRLHEAVNRHEKDLYRGNGKPGLTTRMAVVEDAVERIGSNLSKIVWLLIGGFITMLSAVTADIIVRVR